MTHTASRGNASNWLIPLADLSLILFVITAATLARQGPPNDAPPPPPPAPTGSFAQGVPASVHIDRPGGPSLGEWLASYPLGVGEQLTVEGYFTPAERAAISARAEDLAQQAIAAGFQPRVILQPASHNQVQALIAADADPHVAQSLLGSAQQ